MKLSATAAILASVLEAGAEDCIESKGVAGCLQFTAVRAEFPLSSKLLASHPRDMNAAQQEVLDKVIEMLGEHFDHAVVAVGCYDEEKQYATSATYSGGVAPALGLCKLYETKWQKEHLWGPDEEF